MNERTLNGYVSTISITLKIRLESTISRKCMRKKKQNQTRFRLSIRRREFDLIGHVSNVSTDKRFIVQYR